MKNWCEGNEKGNENKEKVIMRIKQRNRFKKDSKDMRNVCY